MFVELPGRPAPDHEHLGRGDAVDVSHLPEQAPIEASDLGSDDLVPVGRSGCEIDRPIDRRFEVRVSKTLGG